MAWRQILFYQSSTLPQLDSRFCRFFSKSSPYLVKVGIPEFLNGIVKERKPM
uniref:Uncharacterized protein n=1 Tax=Kalanchoe fedtschenkoi TaxID=63787 RepID=A0A7N0V3H4_KALFE